MNMKKDESRQELLNRAFIYVLFIGISVIIFLRVKPLLFDLFVAVVLAALANQLFIDFQRNSVERYLPSFLSHCYFW